MWNKYTPIFDCQICSTRWSVIILYWAYAWTARWQHKERREGGRERDTKLLISWSGIKMVYEIFKSFEILANISYYKLKIFISYVWGIIIAWFCLMSMPIISWLILTNWSVLWLYIYYQSIQLPNSTRLFSDVHKEIILSGIKFELLWHYSLKSSKLF